MKNKVFSKTMANSSLAMCYIEECVNEPSEKRYIYYFWDKIRHWYIKNADNGRSYAC